MATDTVLVDKIVQDADDWLTTRETADLVRRPEATLRKWRMNGVGPRSFRVRGRVFYPRSGVTGWLANQVTTSLAGDHS